MKKSVGIVLLIAMFSMILGMTALAAASSGGFYNIEVADGANVVIEPMTAGKVSVTVTDVDVDGKEGTEAFYPDSERLSVTLTGTKAGEQYLVLLTDDQETVPSVSTAIWYIDQQSTGTSITFDVYPSAAALNRSKALKLWITSSDADFGTKTAILHYYLPYTLSDVNEDGKINAQDATAALQIAAGNYSSYTQQRFLAADVNGNGSVASNDAGLILQRAANNISSFPAESAS